MEWQGVNLTHFHQTQWQKRSVRNLILLFITLVLSAFMATAIYRLSLQKITQNQPLVAQLTQLQTQQTQLEQHIAQLRSQAQFGHHAPLPKPFLRKALKLFTALPLKHGGIEHINISADQEAIIQLSGQLTSEQEFERLQDYLNQQSQFSVQIASFQTSHDGYIIFTFNIKEKKHED